MVLTKSELIASLQNEVRLLLHLASRHTDDYLALLADRSEAELRAEIDMFGEKSDDLHSNPALPCHARRTPVSPDAMP